MALSGATRSMRLSRLPRGTWTAPAGGPAATRRPRARRPRAAPSSACAPVRVDLRDLGLRPARAGRDTWSFSDVNGSCRYLHSRMSATARMRAIVAVIAVVAAAVVAGVVYATRQDPAQPKARCKTADRADRSGRVDRRTSRPSAAFAKWPTGCGTCARGHSPTENPTDPVVQFNNGRRRSTARGYVAEAVQAFRKAKKAGRDTRYEVVCRQHPSPAVLQQGLPAVPVRGSRSAARPGPGAQRKYHQETAERLWSRRRAAPPERRGRAGCRRGRAVRHGRPERVVLAARPAREAVPEEPDGAVPPRAAARMDGSGRARGEGVQGRAGARARRRRSGRKQMRSSSVSEAVGLTVQKDEPSGLCVRPVAMRSFRIRRGGDA